MRIIEQCTNRIIPAPEGKTPEELIAWLESHNIAVDYINRIDGEMIVSQHAKVIA